MPLSERRIVKRPEHPNARPDGTIPYARVVASALVGRPLAPGEEVHHKNGNSRDDDPQNLQVCSSHAAHMAQESIDRARRKRRRVLAPLERLLKKKIAVAPGAAFRTRVREPHGLTIGEAAAALGLKMWQLTSFERGERRVRDDLAQRLASMGGTAEFWLQLQRRYDRGGWPENRSAGHGRTDRNGSDGPSSDAPGTDEAQ